MIGFLAVDIFLEIDFLLEFAWKLGVVLSLLTFYYLDIV